MISYAAITDKNDIKNFDNVEKFCYSCGKNTVNIFSYLFQRDNIREMHSILICDKCIIKSYPDVDIITKSLFKKRIKMIDTNIINRIYFQNKHGNPNFIEIDILESILCPTHFI